MPKLCCYMTSKWSSFAVNRGVLRNFIYPTVLIHRFLIFRVAKVKHPVPCEHSATIRIIAS